MKVTFLFLLLILNLIPATVSGSFEHHSPDARVEAMGGAGVALENSPFGIFYNPASRAAEKNRSAGISYALPFGQSSFDSFYGTLQTNALSFDRNGCAGISWLNYGSSLYNETFTFLTYATKVAGPLRAGISAGILDRDTAEKGSESTLGVNLGVLTSLSSSVNLGASIFNLNRPETGKNGENAPSTSFAGLAYKPSTDIVLNAVIEKREKKDARLRAGGEVRVFSFLNLRAGFTTGPSTFSGGAGFIFESLQGDIALVHHPELGTGSWYTMRIAF